MRAYWEEGEGVTGLVVKLTGNDLVALLEAEPGTYIVEDIEGQSGSPVVVAREDPI